MGAHVNVGYVYGNYCDGGGGGGDDDEYVWVWNRLGMGRMIA